MKFFPKTAEEFLTSMLMAENALLPDFILDCPAQLFGADPMASAKTVVKELISLPTFPCAQMHCIDTRYTHGLSNGRFTLTCSIQYMSTGKEVNDLRCIAADIAGSIRSHLPDGAGFPERIRAYQLWLSRFFTYRNTGSARDHAAVSFLQTRQGVCQAIAALSVVILPHLDIPVRYVSGSGYSGTDWGSHAWNAVQMPGGTWQHVDFTFGLHRRTPPNTFTPTEAVSFCQTHTWDKSRQTPALFQNTENRENALQNAAVRLFSDNPHKAEISGVQVLFDEPVWTENRVRLLPLLNLLGSGCEMDLQNRRLHITRKTGDCSLPLSGLPENGLVPLETLSGKAGAFTAFRTRNTILLTQRKCIL